MTDDITARRAWARALIRRCPNPPRYGSPQWLAEPEGSLAKVAGVIVAAEAWATEGDELPERLAYEVEALRAAYLRDEDADYCARRDEHRATWRPGSASFVPDPAIVGDVEAEFQRWVDGEDA